MDASQTNSMLNSFDEEMEDFELEVSHREGTQLITFILGSEKYGFENLKVRELVIPGDDHVRYARFHRRDDQS